MSKEFHMFCVALMIYSETRKIVGVTEHIRAESTKSALRKAKSKHPKGWDYNVIILE